MADHTHTIDRATGQNLVEQIAAVGDYLVELETFRAAVKRWPKHKITLRNRARIMLKALRAGKVMLIFSLSKHCFASVD